jgi:hypothetical protein
LFGSAYRDKRRIVFVTFRAPLQLVDLLDADMNAARAVGMEQMRFRPVCVDHEVYLRPGTASLC